MARIMIHSLLEKSFSQAPNKPGLFAARRIKVKINRIGELKVSAQVVKVLKPLPPIQGQPHENKIKKETINFKWDLLDPDGKSFKNKVITAEDLNRYRDLRGFIKEWELVISEYYLPPNEYVYFEGPQKVLIEVKETLETSSAPPLIEKKMSVNPQRDFEFDLYRVGELRAGAGTTQSGQNTIVKVSLISPDGKVVATSNNGRLQFMVKLEHLRQSRGPDGIVRKWKLRFEATDKSPYNIYAQVYGTLRIPKDVLLGRLHALLGEKGEKITIGVNWDEKLKKNEITVTFNDERLIETLDIHNIFSLFHPNLNIRKYLENPEVGRPYVLFRDPFKFTKSFDFLPDLIFQAKFKDFEIDDIIIKMGSSDERRALKTEQTPGSNQWVTSPTGEIRLPENLPSFIIEFKTDDTIPIAVDTSVSDWDDAELVVRGIRLEIGLEITKDGQLLSRSWVDPESVKFGGKEGGPSLPASDTLRLKIDQSVEYLTVLTDIFRKLFDRMLGGVFQFTDSSWKEDAMEFEYIAGVEKELRPTIGYAPHGDSAKVGPGGFVKDPFKKDTWTSPNLSKIDHIVVLMMENRSFDHVLGYLSLNQINANVKGLTQEIVEKFSTNGNFVRPLSEAGFKVNTAGLRTQLPLGVGHEVEHVIQQLAFKNGEATMTGFADNFYFLHGIKKGEDKLTDLQREGCKPQDVLGYYTDADLAMYGFLAKEFGICDNYFCSHPGPTLPNRMFSLIGDFQRDRNGEPRIHNGLDSSFFLAREQNIFDLLSQRQVSWKVYESFPSVTMLRMFSRYASNDTNIRDIKHIKNDIQQSGLPSVTFIDPRMHNSPPNDDHPPADMLHGQHLIKDIYEILIDASNQEIWKKTLFIITYDEHGGLFDHIPPPIAETFQDPLIFKGPVVVTPGGSNTNPYQPDEKVIYGVRVPTFLVSPWIEQGHVCNTLFDHTSILKTILVRFCGADRPFLSDRVHYANNLGAALTLNSPRNIQTSPPELPSFPEGIFMQDKKKPMIRKSRLFSESADFHEFMEMLQSTLKP